MACIAFTTKLFFLLNMDVHSQQTCTMNLVPETVTQYISLYPSFTLVDVRVYVIDNKNSHCIALRKDAAFPDPVFFV